MRAVRAGVVGILSAVVLAGAIPGAGARLAERGAWKPSLPTTGFGTHVSAFKDGSAFAYDDGEDVVYTSTDFGMTWTPKDSPVAVNPPVASVPSLFEMATPKVGFFAEGESVYRTSDGGTTWDTIGRLPTPGGLLDGTMKRYSYNLFAIDASDEDSVVALGGSLQDWKKTCQLEGIPAALWTSHDKGKKWFRRVLPFPGQVKEIAFFDNLHGVAIAWEYGRNNDPQWCLRSIKDRVLTTKDGGKTWKTVMTCPHVGPKYDACTAIGMASPKQFVVGTSTGRTLVTKNGGRSFKEGTRLHQGTPANDAEETKRAFWAEGFDFVNSQVGFASTNGGGTWMTSDGGLTWSEEHTTEKFFGYLKFGDIAAIDADRAIAAGSTFVLTRLPVPEP